MLPPVVTLYHVNVFDDVLIVDVSAREEIWLVTQLRHVLFIGTRLSFLNVLFFDGIL
jgi:hypothetical protein